MTRKCCSLSSTVHPPPTRRSAVLLHAERSCSVPVVEPLSRDHDREHFDCGVEALNAFLRQTARQHQERGISRTFVLTGGASKPPKPILAFFTLAATEGFADRLAPVIARRLPTRIPAVVLARLAVAT